MGQTFCRLEDMLLSAQKLFCPKMSNRVEGGNLLAGDTQKRSGSNKWLRPKKRSSGMDAKLLIAGGRGIKAQKQVKGWPGSSNIKSGALVWKSDNQPKQLGQTTFLFG